MSQTRGLAAIMFTDIVGYTALMGSDDKKAFALLRKNREIQKPAIKEYHGRWIKEMGDGVIASFSTASDALSAAKKIQEACVGIPDLHLRIGIHLGEVVFENNDIFGDGVNIASRIESLGVAGSVLMSKTVRDQIKNNSEFQLESLGNFDFKNVSEPIEVFALSNPGFIVPRRSDMQGKLKSPHEKSNPVKWIGGFVVLAIAVLATWYFTGRKSVPEEAIDRSIAVLPFVDMSQAKDQEYFSDGLSENVIDLLAKVPSLKVIGRTSSFSFKGKNEDLRVIGEKLGAATILEGSVQKDGNKLRITAQLIRCSDGTHLWSEKFDRELKDIFSVQDEISMAILEAIKVELVGEEKEAVLKRYTENVEAYQFYMQGRFHVHRYTPDGFYKAIEYFKAAIALDSNYAIAYSEMAFCYMNLFTNNWAPADQSRPQAIHFANEALELDDELAETHLNAGRIKLHFEYKTREAEILFKKAITINPNNSEVLIQLAFCAALLGKNKEAIEYANRAVTLDPFSLLNIAYIGGIYWTVGDLEKVLETGKRSVDIDPNFPYGHIYLGMYYLLTKKNNESISEFERAVELYPNSHNLSDLGCGYAFAGEKEKARGIIDRIKKHLEQISQRMPT